jgi:hypothetical protein
MDNKRSPFISKRTPLCMLDSKSFTYIFIFVFYLVTDKDKTKAAPPPLGQTFIAVSVFLFNET